jgi:uncharacterized MAPEG superfamily protein
MTVGLACLLGFAAWTLLLVVFGIGFTRIGKIVAGKARPNDFAADVPHGSERYRRIMRAHANCVENLPLFGAVVITGAITGMRGGLFDSLPVVYLATRVAQSLTHIASGGSKAVSVRFALFLAQIACLVWLGVLVAVNA